jgi:hypothetical protein
VGLKNFPRKSEGGNLEIFLLGIFFSTPVLIIDKKSGFLKKNNWLFALKLPTPLLKYTVVARLHYLYKWFHTEQVMQKIGMQIELCDGLSNISV